jgi:predicted phosphate transport protein (TIGR00153 family)
MTSKLVTQFRNWRQRLFIRRPNHFISRLVEQATLVVEGTAALKDYMKKPSKKNAAQVRNIEKQADEVRRMMIDELNRTFVTPIDREDLFGLSRAIDDVLDHAYSTTSEMDILDVQPNHYLQTMVEMLHSSAEEIHLAMERLEHHPNVADSHAVRAKAIENRMEILYAEAIADLFKKPSDLQAVVDMMKLREIYRHMLYAVQAAEDAANIISDIVVKFY